MQCPKNNLNLRIKTEPVTDSTVYVWLLFYISIPQHQTYTVASMHAPTVTGLFSMLRIRLFWDSVGWNT